jgi:PAS domain S-box-containing protein
VNKRRILYSITIILLLIATISGWFVTVYVGNKARQEIVGESQTSVSNLSSHVSSTLNNIEGAAKFVAGSIRIGPALISKRDQDIEDANSALDRYNFALHATVSYLMDAGGMTVASSNRKDPDSFVGKSYRFRPYFQEAAKGKAGRYFALGITSGKRGFYTSYPVQNSLGNVLGVVAVKKELDEIEVFFSKYPFCFLVNPDGIIFLSSTPSMVLKSLWPLDKAVLEKLIASQQFGNKFSEAVFKKEIADGAEVTLEGQKYFVSRKVIDTDGWSIVLLTPTDRIMSYGWISILATISLCLLIIVFSAIIYVRNRAKEVIRQSEESRRLLLDTIGDGIIGVDARGQVTFVNPAALRMLLFSLDEMSGKSLHSLIHHSHADGSNYPLEDCPMYASYTQAVDSFVTDELIWRKDGSNFPVEYSSIPTTKDGKVVGAVVTFKDITERKWLEEEKTRNQLMTEQFAKQMEIIARIGRVVGSTLDINQVYERVAAEAAKLIPYDRLLVNLKKNNDNEFVVVYASGADNPRRRLADTYPSQGSATGIVMSTRTGILIQPDDAEEIKDLYPNLYETFKTGLRSTMSVPLISMDEVIGSMNFRSKILKAYTEQDLLLAERIGTQIAGAIANAQLYKDLKETEKSLYESEKHYHDLFSKANEGLLILALDGQLSEVNQAFAEMHGYTVDELKRMDIRVLDVLKERSLEEGRNEILLRIQAGEVVRFEVEHYHKDGHAFPLTVTSSMIQLRGQNYYLAFHQDITNRRLAQEALEEEHRRLQQSLDEIRTLRGIVPICAYCKKIRDDEGYWNQVEKYVSDHTEAKFSHGICPACLEREMKDVKSS